jgi:hypothetical protein
LSEVLDFISLGSSEHADEFGMKAIVVALTAMRAELFRQILTTHHSIIELSPAGYTR